MINARAIAQTPYKTVFLGALLVASFLPALVSVINYEITSQSLYTVTFIFSLLLVLGGAHVWLTLAYYANPKWLAHFKQHRFEFFWAPAAILAICTLVIVQPYKPLGIAALAVVTFLNLWHHAKQNWGILSMIGKIRKSDVAGLRLPLIYAWPFFVAPWALVIPEPALFISKETIYALAVTSVISYAAYCLYFAWKTGFIHNRDPVTILFAVTLSCYFVPIVALYGKPYAIAVWSVAHALQYYVLVGASLSLHERRQLNLKKTTVAFVFVLGSLGLLTAGSWLSTMAIGTGDFWASITARTIVGVVLGINLVHYWVDRFIWKFSEKDVRQLHGEAFAF